MIIPINVNLCFCDRLGLVPRYDSTDKMVGFFNNPFNKPSLETLMGIQQSD